MTEQSKRITRQLTPEERARWRQAAAEEDQARPENSADALRTLEAIREPTFSGELRRAIGAALPRLQVRDVAERASVPFPLLNGFMGGKATLDSDQVDRIVAVLNCGLLRTPNENTIDKA